MKTIHVVAALIEKENKVLIAQRLKGEFKGLWEFPGGKVEANETNEEAIIREIKEEFDADIKVNKFLCKVEHDYDFHLIMDCYLCEMISKEFVLHDHLNYRFIDPYEENINYLPADIKVIKEYQKLLQQNEKKAC